MSKKFTTAAKARTAIEFELDEVMFKFTPPKSAASVMPLLEESGDEMSLVRAGFDWLKDGLADDQYAILVNRMKDPADDFDLPDLEEIIEYLMEQVSNDRPIL